MIVLAIVMIVAGVVAITFPMLSSFGVELTVGMMLIIAGIAQAMGAFSLPKWKSMTLAFILGALWVIAGGYLVMYPLQGMFALTIVVAATFVAEGVLKTIFAFQLRPLSVWGWALFDGIIAIVLGVMLMVQFPFSALWALGMLVGINLLMSGVSLVMIATAVGKVFDQSAE
ncbi:DUF308 domain-containing protein [Hoeflea sp. IMCC20628]|uniref:HdeD family acid-resistance protein n=1 Tax=Hoeflea sp. IMCC20628 TaxID=1620421 RepID=UPI0018CF8A5C|nr:DUF308 domain-containing protein [Hoeflea sp. IMCC20628]